MPLPDFSGGGTGYLREGYWADIVVVDPTGKTLVKDSQLFSKCGWSPFSQMTFTNSIGQPSFPAVPIIRVL